MTDISLQSGAAWLVNVAMTLNPTAAAATLATVSKELSSRINVAKAAEDGNTHVLTKEEELERKKNIAKEKAMARMKTQMAKFAANIGEDSDHSDSISPLRERSQISTNSTLVQNRADSTGTEGIQAMN